MTTLADVASWIHVLKVLRTYDVPVISEPYWNRAFRDRLAYWLEWSMEENLFHPTSSPSSSDVTRLIGELRLPTKQRTSAKDRKLAMEMLRIIVRKATRPPPRFIPVRECTLPTDPAVWPEMESKLDLEGPLNGGLRFDVVHYLTTHFDTCGVERISFDLKAEQPVTVHIYEWNFDAAQRIYDGLPDDIEFGPKQVTKLARSTLRQPLSFAATGEEAATCGTAIGQAIQAGNIPDGCFGCFIAAPKKVVATDVSVSGVTCHTQREDDVATDVSVFGVTCQHVVSSAPLQPGIRHVVEGHQNNTIGADIALVTLDDAVYGRPHQNNVAFAVPSAPDDEPEIGEAVWKVGAATGFTRGTLLDYKVACGGYNNAVLVRWAEGSKFATVGDSGAVYFIERRGIFIPIAFHVASDPARLLSVGLDFMSNMSHLASLRRGVPNAVGWSFVNPPYGATELNAQRALVGYLADYERCKQEKQTETP